MTLNFMKSGFPVSTKLQLRTTDAGTTRDDQVAFDHSETKRVALMNEQLHHQFFLAVIVSKASHLRLSGVSIPYLCVAMTQELQSFYMDNCEKVVRGKDSRACKKLSKYRLGNE